MKKLLVLVNFIFISVILNAQIEIKPEEAKSHMGQVVSVCDKVVDAVFLESSITKPTLLNMGGTYPNHFLTIVINRESRQNFSFKPEEYYLNKNICVTGKVVDFKGKPQIIVLSPAEILTDQKEVRRDNNTSPNTARTTTTQTPAPISKPAAPITNNQIKNVNTDSITKVAPVNKTNTVSNTSASSTKPPTPVVKTETSKKSSKPEAVKPSSKPIVERDVKPADNNKASDVYDIKLTSSVNLRSGPGESFDLVDVIKPGSTVTILESKNGWSRLTYERFSTEQKRAITLEGFAKNSLLR